MEQLENLGESVDNGCGNLPKRWVEQPEFVHNSTEVAVEICQKGGWNSGAVASSFFSSLWKSAKKVGGTAQRQTLRSTILAVEICQKGGWNSTGMILASSFMAVEICQKGGWNSAHGVCQRGLVLWKSAKKVGGTAPFALPEIMPFAVEICQKGGWNSLCQSSLSRSFAVEICQKGGWNS